MLMQRLVNLQAGRDVGRYHSFGQYMGVFVAMSEFGLKPMGNIRSGSTPTYLLSFTPF